MTDLPTLGPVPKSPFIPGLLACAAIAGLAGGAFYVMKHREADAARLAASKQAEPVAVAVAVAPVEPVAPVTPVAAVTAPAAVPVPAVTPTPVAAAPSTPAEQPAPSTDGLKTVAVRIDGALETAIIAKVGKTVGAPLTQVVKRALVWWASIPADLVRGDTVSVVYEERDRSEPVVHAVQFKSARFDKTFAAWRYQKPGDAFARFYTSDGRELEQRLDHGPLDSWEQITSLLKDGRKHHGVDFKTPVGTPVKAPFDGTLERKNWSFRGNGNCLELVEASAPHRHALFLHLSELPKSIQVGQRVRQGDVLAKSGNSGHSFAAHLHYQLMLNDKVIDPFTSHTTHRAALSDGELAGFREAFAKLEKRLPTSALATR